MTTPEGPPSHLEETCAPDIRTPGAPGTVVLVAEDEDPIRKLVVILMEKEGHLVISARDGHEGLELSREYAGKIDLVIADVNMPRLNGADLCTHLVEERPGIKVLIMSAIPLNAILTLGNLPFLAKPFDGQILVEKVRALLADPASSAGSTVD